MNNNHKKIILILLINLFIYSILTNNRILLFLTIINGIILLIININLFNYFKTIKEYYEQIDENHQQTYGFLSFIKYYIQNYILIISFILVLFGIGERVLQTYLIRINTLYASIILGISIIITFKDTLSGNIFIGKRLLVGKNYIFIFSLSIAYCSLLLSKDFDLVGKFFYSTLSGFVFYISSIIIFYPIGYKRLSKDLAFHLYLSILLISGSIFAINNVPKLSKLITKERIVYKEKEIIVEKPIIKEINCNQTGSQESKTNTGSNLTGNTINAYNTGNTSITNNTGINILEKQLTYREIIPYIVDKYNLTKTTTNLEFKNIKKTDPMYNNFNIAYTYKMFGKGSNPDAKVTCNSLVVLIGLAEKWKLEYDSSNVFSKFWTEASKHNLNLGCQKDDFVTQAHLQNF